MIEAVVMESYAYSIYLFGAIRLLNSCTRQVLCFSEMGFEHVPLSCVGQGILSRAEPCYPVSNTLFFELRWFGAWGLENVLLSCLGEDIVEIWAPNTSRYPVSGTLVKGI